MAIQTMILDPNATPDQSGDEIIAAINAGGTALTRPDSVDQDALNLVMTAPGLGEFHIKNIHRKADGKVIVQYDDVPVV